MTATKIRQSPKLPAEVRREQLLQAAALLFRKKGYAKTSTDEVARAAGLTKGALYFHYRSKEDVLIDLIKHIEEQYLSAARSHGYGSVPAHDALRFIVNLTGRPDMPAIEMAQDIESQGAKVPRVREYLLQAGHRRIDLFCRMVSPDSGLTTKEKRELATMTFSLFHGLNYSLMLDSKKINIKAQIRLYAEMVRARYGTGHAKAKPAKSSRVQKRVGR